MEQTAYIFPGQGAQAVGMGKDVAEASDDAAEVFNRANRVLGFDLAEVCFTGPAERLEETDIQQPAILVTSIALWAALTRGGRDVPPFAAAAGLSLGEYTALYVAGAVSFEDAVRLVYRRGQLMQASAEAAPSGMVSILGLSADEVQAICRQAADGDVLQPANFNCPGQIVVSGHRAACERAVRIVESGKGKAVMLKVAGAFHSELMRPAAEQLRIELAQTRFRTPRVPVLSNVDVLPHGDCADIRDALYRQVFSPVRWQASIEGLITYGIEMFMEVGPGRTLTGMMRKIDRTRKAVNVSGAESVGMLQTSAALP